MVLTEESSGAVQRLKVGESAEIRLRARFGTGFSWVAAHRSAGLIPLPQGGSDSPQPGGEAVQRFRFSSARPGTFRVVFDYKQPWSGGLKSGRASFTFEVR
jgi:predicted secreted protein